ncbi:MAG: hypothetical protein HZB12_00005 [Candidatus Yonathbacteria bacterium]|nr:hypothetical protein [Candidatus Yonathbacteria bacterium]
MIPFQERKKLRKILYSKTSIALLFLALFVAGKGAWSIHQKAQIAISERDISARLLSDLQSRTTELQASLVRLKSDRGIEEEVRQKYTVARPGEEVVVVVDEKAKKSENGAMSTSTSWWREVVSFFGF